MNKMKNGRYATRAGNVRWYKDDQLHRVDGPALEEARGWTSWYFEGQLHRDDGTDHPAAVHIDGHSQWWRNGRLHRESGPAVIWPNGKKEWYWEGCQISEEEFKQHISKRDLNEKLQAILPPRFTEKKSKI